MKQQTKLICLSLLFLLIININILANEETTIIDVSNMSIGENVVHNHVYKSQYDDTNHWTECLICHDKKNIEQHTITTTWAMGKESCEKNNYAIKSCDCGYSETYKKPCVWTGSYTKSANAYSHTKTCNVCKENITSSYYKNTYGVGQLYKDENTSPFCTTSNGTIINCLNGGTCSTCGATHTKGTHYLRFVNDITCTKCNTNFGSYSVTSSHNFGTPALYTTIVKVSLKNGATFDSVKGLRNYDAYSSLTNNYSTNATKTTATITYKSQLSTTYKVPYSTYATFYVLIDNKKCLVATSVWLQPIEYENPTIMSMETNDISFSNDDWITSKEIKINGTENYCNNVSIKVVDENNVVAYNGTTNVSNKNYSFEFIPAIEANEVEKTYTINVTDANNNTTTKELIVKKVDAKEPTFEIVSTKNMKKSENDSNVIIETSGWSKSKTYDLSFKDEGIGNVSIGVNNYDDIVLATYDENLGVYKRNYTFIGDTYEPVNCVIYAKDALGNLSTTTLVLDKIDNTSPTIEKIDKEINEVEVLSAISDETTHNNEPNKTTYANIIITANDINEKLGLEGSGVVSYGVQSSNSDEIIWYDTNEIEITQNGTYYIYAKDSVGNISTPMLLVIDELTSSEDNNGNKVNVYVTQASTFSVVIPKTIILSGETKNATYQILVKGNIGGLDSISIVPDNILALKQYGKDDILANVTQEKTTFNYNDGMTSETPTTTNGTIVAPNMTAGSWSGSFNFNIKFNMIGNTNSVGSIKEDVSNENPIGFDKEQDKYTSYTYGIENETIENN